MRGGTHKLRVQLYTVTRRVNILTRNRDSIAPRIDLYNLKNKVWFLSKALVWIRREKQQFIWNDSLDPGSMINWGTRSYSSPRQVGSIVILYLWLYLWFLCFNSFVFRYTYIVFFYIECRIGKTEFILYIC